MRPTRNSGMKKMEVYICLNEANDGLVVLGDVYNAVARKTWAVPIQLSEVDGAFAIPSKAEFDGKTYPVTEIAEGAFKKKKLTGLIIHNTVTTIGMEEFQKCHIDRISLPDSLKKIGRCAFMGCTGFNSVVIPASLKRIEQGVFSDCANLSSVTIGNSVKFINESAFSSCRSLKRIIIPDSVWIIEGYAFSHCESLDSVVIPGSVSRIGEGAFYCCESLTSVVIPKSVSKIGKWAFSNCVSLTSIVLPNSLTRIEEKMFSGCRSLSSIVIPQSVTEIGKDAFKGCSDLTEVHYNGTLEQWEKISFNNKYNTLIHYKRKVFIQGQQVHLKQDENLPGGEKRVDPLQYAKEFAFLDDPILRTLNFDLYESSTFNKKNFYTNLAFVIDRLQKKDKSTWESVVKQFLDSLFELDDDVYRLLYADAFLVTYLRDAYEEGGNYFAEICSRDLGCLFNRYCDPRCRDENGLFRKLTIGIHTGGIPKWFWTWFDKSELESEIIDENKRSFVNSIRHMRGDEDLEEVRNAPSDMARKHRECYKGFYFTDNTHSVVTGCMDKTLSSISIPNTVKRIGKFAFHGCRELTNVIIPDSVEVIDWFAFAECEKLTSITLPDSVKEVGEYAFHSCKHFETIRLNQKAYDQCGSTLPKKIPYDGRVMWYKTKEVEIVIIDNMDVRRVKESTDEDVEQLQKYLRAWRHRNE